MSVEIDWTPEQWQQFFRRRKLVNQAGQAVDDRGQQLIAGLEDVPLNLPAGRGRRQDHRQATFSFGGAT